MGVFAVTSRARADSLREYLQSEMSVLNDTLVDEDPGVCSAMPKYKSEAWLFRRFTLRIRPVVTLTAGIAQIGIVPDIEILWERTLPEGWAEFRPSYK
jgi:hypothetical protein